MISPKYSFLVSETWSKPAISGIKPSPRDKHTAITWGSKLVVFGGFGPAGEEDSEEEGGPESVNFSWFKDTFTFDTATSVWEEIVQAQNGTFCQLHPRQIRSFRFWKCANIIMFSSPRSNSCSGPLGGHLQEQDVCVRRKDTRCSNSG